MLTYSLDKRGVDSLYGYLYQCIRRDVEAGVIAANEKLPSKRALAKHLGISLITVEGAYAQLIAEGYVRSEVRKGYFANAVSRTQVSNGCKKGQGLSRATTLPVASGVSTHQPPLLADLTGGAAVAGMFPSATWAKTLRDMLSHESEQELLRESPSMGTLRLRNALAVHLRTFRGLEVEPEQILVGSGAQTLYGLIVQLLGRHNHFAVEEPGYSRLTKIYKSNDVRLSQVPLDAQGISMQNLRAEQANVVHLMPSHQFPTGLVTPISRRYELLGWATEVPDRYLVEDDYDCEFRLAGRPIPTMMSIDADERVVYTNTFSRSLGPAFRIAYAVLPLHLAERFQDDLSFYSCTVSTMEQLVLARFIENGDFERHVNRMRSHYRTVRDKLLDALTVSSLSSYITIEGADAGLHFLLCLEAQPSEAVLAAAARREGVALIPLSSFYRQIPTVSGDKMTQAPTNSHQYPLFPVSEQAPRRFLVSYAGLAVDAITPAVQSLVRAWS